ncbi:hypothetical protein GCM10008905_26520 [Clostridium malenominatum]|uniref:CARDB domain-containing protein n=1 Tax=Clostridium malenominatum TaxID=1539 RepID=A0ABP3UF17_9CLOT
MKRLFSFLLSLMLLLSGISFNLTRVKASNGDAISKSKDIASVDMPITPIDTSTYMATLTIVEGDMLKFSAGDLIKVPVAIKNIGSHAAKNLIITPDLTDKECPFTLEYGTLSKAIETINSKETANIEFKLRIKNNVAEGMYPLKLNFKYSNVFGDKAVTMVETINVKIVNDSVMPKLQLEKITTTPTDIKPGEKVMVDFVVKNKGTIEAKDVKVVVDGIGKNFVIVNNSNSQYLGTIAGEEAKNIKLELQAADNIEKGGQAIDLKLSGKDIPEETYKFFVNVGGGGANLNPKLIIDRYSFQPKLVRAGQNFDMNLSFFNTNANKSVKNIKITLTVDEKTEGSGSVFSPVNTSNTFYIDEIPPKGRVEKNITMFTVPDAKAKTYTLTANFEYEDEDGKELKATELIGVPVVQQTKLEIGNIELPPEGFIGQPIPINVQFYNKGKVTLSNVMIELKGDFSTENGQYFLGNFEAGNSESYDGSVIPNAPGPLKGTLVFSYDNTAGEHVEVKKDFNINVMEMPAMEPGMDNMPPDMKPATSKKKLIISSSLFLVTVAGFIIWKKNKKKKGMTLDE